MDRNNDNGGAATGLICFCVGFVVGAALMWMHYA